VFFSECVSRTRVWSKPAVDSCPPNRLRRRLPFPQVNTMIAVNYYKWVVCNLAYLYAYHTTGIIDVLLRGMRSQPKIFAPYGNLQLIWRRFRFSIPEVYKAVGYMLVAWILNMKFNSWYLLLFPSCINIDIDINAPYQGRRSEKNSGGWKGLRVKPQPGRGQSPAGGRIIAKAVIVSRTIIMQNLD